MVELARDRVDGRLVGGSKREEKTEEESFSFAFHLSPKRGAFYYEAGFLTCRSSSFTAFPFLTENSGVDCKRLAAYSGGTVRDLHPLPSLFALTSANTSKQVHRITPGDAQPSPSQQASVSC